MQWVTIRADNFEAVVSLRSLQTHPPNLLAELAEVEMSSGCTSPTVRLDCSAATAEEVVAVLRQGSFYLPPDDPRLRSALAAQLDMLGIDAPGITAALPWPGSAAGREVLLLPSYLRRTPAVGTEAKSAAVSGLLMYSSSISGWANRCGPLLDPRPVTGFAPVNSTSTTCLSSYGLAAVLKAETTPAGEDLIYIVPNDDSYWYSSAPAFMLTSRLSMQQICQPPEHTHMGLVDSSLAAAGGKLFLLGGQARGARRPAHPQRQTPFEVYDAAIDTWFAAAQPVRPASLLPDQEQFVQPSLVSSLQEGLLVALGGGWRPAQQQHGAAVAVNDTVFVFDVRSPNWSSNPSGCRWSRAAMCDWQTAVAADAHTIMVLSSTQGCDASQVDLLDLRMWRWRKAAALPRPDSMVTDIGCCLYAGKVVAVGGSPARDAVQCGSSTAQAYDLRADSWATLPELPLALSKAQPVAVRLASTL